MRERYAIRNRDDGLCRDQEPLDLSAALGSERVDNCHDAVTDSQTRPIDSPLPSLLRRLQLRTPVELVMLREGSSIGLSLLRDWTMAIRGSRHTYQTEEFARALAAAVDVTFRQEHRCSPDDFVTMMLGVIATLEERMQAHLEWLRRWMRKRSGIARIIQWPARLCDIGEGEEVARRRPDKRATTLNSYRECRVRLANRCAVSHATVGRAMKF